MFSNLTIAHACPRLTSGRLRKFVLLQRRSTFARNQQCWKKEYAYSATSLLCLIVGQKENAAVLFLSSFVDIFSSIEAVCRNMSGPMVLTGRFDCCRLAEMFVPYERERSSFV